MVDGAGHVGEQLGVAVGVAGHQAADLDAGGLLGPGGEHRPRLEVHAVGLSVERVEVVPVEDHVDADLLRAARGVADLGIVGVLGLDLDSDADGHVSNPTERLAFVLA